ncbi:MAG: RecX family transcriptional regulator [Desulfobacteraceae bacterium]|nr:RecX family transcriptional regulator [Desulfobacteraceae bacterium]
MNGRITAITPQKRNKRRYNVFIDEAYAFSVSERLAVSLPVGGYLEADEIERLKAEDQREHALSRAMHYLKFRPRSREEVRAFLEKKGFAGTIIADTLKKLENFKYLDDAEFARAWIESRCRHRPRGEFALRHELYQKGVKEVIIDRMLADFQEAEPAWRAVAPKLAQWKKFQPFDLKKKIFDHLRRRGFSFETCEAVYQKVLTDFWPD